jgi:hypothetical protein
VSARPVTILAEADFYVVQREAALRKEAEDLRERLRDIIDNMDPDQFLETLLVADQTAPRPRVKPGDLDHERFYWIFKNLDYDRWFAQDSGVLLLSGPANCYLDHVSSHILGLVEEGHFGKDRIPLNFFSPDWATRGNKPSKIRRDRKVAATIFVHTLLHQFITAAVSEKSRISAASGFLYHLLDSLDDTELLPRFKLTIWENPLAVIRKLLDMPDKVLYDGLERVLEGEEALAIVVNVSDIMGGRESDFITSLCALIRRLSERTPGLKVLLTSPSAMPLGGPPYMEIQYDKERRGLITPLLS